MSLQIAAQHLARQGRGPDTELVHMGRGEVKALQEIARKHGGSLTINPHTGLAEAGFLSRILPTIAGVGLSMIPGVGPLMAAGLVGAGVGLAKGSLKKGLMAGLGAYGGASLGASLGAAGVGSTAPAAVGTGVEAAVPEQIASTAAEATPGLPVSGGDVASIPMNPASTGVGEVFQPQAGLANQVAYTPPPITTAMGPPAPSVPMGPPAPNFDQLGSASDRAAAMGRGLSGENVMNFAKQNPFTTAGTVASWMPQPKKPKEIEEDTSMPEYSYNQGTDDSVFSSPDYQSNLASGKEMGYFKNRGFTKKAAGGGIMYGLGGYSDGGRLLRGPGDGVSDSIPAVIGKKQPARLADGEFVIPARIVSELGNGSTEAGARKLYAMMDRVQKARKKSTGKNKVAHNSRSEKYLPA